MKAIRSMHLLQSKAIINNANDLKVEREPKKVPFFLQPFVRLFSDELNITNPGKLR